MIIKRLSVLAGASLLGMASSVHAFIFEPGVGLGWQYSDNVALSPDDEEADWGAVAYLGGNLFEDGGPLTYNIGGTLTYQRYANSTFDDTTYFNLGARVNWEQVQDRVNWLVDNFFTQSPINSLGRDVPTNIENRNVFSIAPDFAFPFASGHRFSIRPFFRDYYFEVSDADNQQYGLDLGWSYPMYPTMRIGVNARATGVNYKDSDFNSDYVRSELRGVISGTRARGAYSVDFGTSRISRDEGNDQTGFGGSASYRYQFTGFSSLRARIATDLTDSSQVFFDSAVDPGTGNPDNVQTSGETFRNNVITLDYNRDGETTDTRVYAEFRDLDYKEAPNDRKVTDIGADFNYQVNPYFGTGLFGSYSRIRDTDRGRTDKRYIIGGRVAYNFSRLLSANAAIQYRDRESTQAGFNYDEFSALIGVVYGFRGRTTGLVGDNVGRY